MNNIFQIVPLKDRGFLQRIFRQTDPEDAIIEINNLLATTPILDISLQKIYDIGLRYKVNIPVEFERNLDEFYAAYLYQCLSDKFLSSQEESELSHLKKLLGLSDAKVAHMHQRLAGIVYKQTLDECIVDGRMDAKEKAFLSKLQIDIRLTDKTVDSISTATKSKYVNAFIEKILSDGRLSPDEEKELQSINHSLDVDLQLSDKTKASFNRYREFWNIENKDLVPIESGINLQKTEVCYFNIPVQWYELRTTTRGYSYQGPSVRVRIMKGFYYNVGSISSHKHTATNLKLIDSGQLYLTNKRVIFMGSLGNKNVPYTKILSFTPYTDGIEVDKDAGKSPFLKMNGDIEKISLIFSKLLRES